MRLLVILMMREKYELNIRKQRADFAIKIQNWDTQWRVKEEIMSLPDQIAQKKTIWNAWSNTLSFKIFHAD